MNYKSISPQILYFGTPVALITTVDEHGHRNRSNSNLPLFDHIPRSAEQKDFENAQKIFSNLEEGSVIEVDHFFHRNIKLNHNKYESRDKVLAVIFLKQLISEWKNLQQAIISQQHSHAQQR